ncbi:hypothetical protein AXG93_4905s1000 [Marchantia polymorpha subsp. ruderalis]|uniref:Uncharacterized protein n=1 Tax=Marchantia polymorpha subsp. ruderalis TaxID=1480154 RepID=A0A176VHQ2_MARPO|nr:hypothetical protein AXG93_4905s1000 [Marchantia polymorpha subsp. ruderalis]
MCLLPFDIKFSLAAGTRKLRASPSHIIKVGYIPRLAESRSSSIIDQPSPRSTHLSRQDGGASDAESKLGKKQCNPLGFLSVLDRPSPSPTISNAAGQCGSGPGLGPWLLQARHAPA